MHRVEHKIDCISYIISEKQQALPACDKVAGKENRQAGDRDRYHDRKIESEGCSRNLNAMR